MIRQMRDKCSRKYLWGCTLWEGGEVKTCTIKEGQIGEEGVRGREGGGGREGGNEREGIH